MGTATSSAFFSPNSIDSFLQSGVTHRGFRPLLYTVVNGAYTGNSVYSSGAAQVSSYQQVQLGRGSTSIPLAGTATVTSTEGCDIRDQDTEVEFVCNICLNGDPNTEPSFGTEELRIRPFPRTFAEPNRYRKGLALPARNLGLPLFEDVEIVNKAGVQIAPDAGTAAGTYKLQARLLQNGDLALVLEDTSTLAATSRGLTHADISAGFAADDVIRIIVRGRYRQNTPVNKGNLPAPSLYK